MNNKFKRLIKKSQRTTGWTTEAHQLHLQIKTAVTDIFRNYLDKGYSWADLGYVAVAAVVDAVAEENLHRLMTTEQEN